MAAKKNVYSDDFKFSLGDDWNLSVYRCNNFVNMSLARWKSGSNGSVFVDKAHGVVTMIRPQFVKLFDLADDMIKSIEANVDGERKFELPFNLEVIVQPKSSDQFHHEIVFKNNFFKRSVKIPVNIVRNLIQMREKVDDQVKKFDAEPKVLVSGILICCRFESVRL